MATFFNGFTRPTLRLIPAEDSSNATETEGVEFRMLKINRRREKNAQPDLVSSQFFDKPTLKPPRVDPLSSWLLDV